MGVGPRVVRVVAVPARRVRDSDYGNKFAAADTDGNLTLWQLHPPATNANQPHAPPRPFFVSIININMHDYGNKFAAADTDGNLALWQLHPPATNKS